MRARQAQTVNVKGMFVKREKAQKIAKAIANSNEERWGEFVAEPTVLYNFKVNVFRIFPPLIFVSFFQK